MHGEPVTESVPIERKVTAASAGSYLSLLAGLTVLQAVQADLDLIAWLPDALETLLIPLLPGLASYLAGFKARHTARPDLPLDQR
ncbi:hypothetical protein [Streptosporangium sp. OZ121]|uniref:hypothetical protein n=1 Tax=Streptosporangium sp. OZ121 TaxID=3444183 RepID=UPI003F7AD23F